MNTSRTSTLLQASVAVCAMGLAGVSSSGATVEYTESFDWNLVYEALALPLESDSIQYSDGTTGAFHEALDDVENLNARLGEGVLSINSSDRGAFGIDAAQEGRFLLNSEIGYTAEIRARLIGTANLTSDPLNVNGASFQLNDGRAGVRHTVHLGLFTHTTTGDNYARVRAGAYSPAVYIGADFHTYTFVVTASGSTFYIDGYFVATLPPWAAVERPEVWLGNFQAGANHTANFEVAHVKIYDGGAVHPVDIGTVELYKPIENLVEPRPKIAGFQEESGNFVLSFETVIGGNYVMESRDDLNQVSPNEPVVQVAGTGGIVAVGDSMAGVARRFYQVAREPEEILYEQNFEWDFRYEGDVDPLAADAIHYKGGTTGGFDVFRTVAGKYRNEEGILMIEYPVPQTEGGAFDVSTAPWNHAFAVNADAGYTVEYRARVDYSLHYGAAVLEINASGGFHHVSLGLVTETVNIVDGETEEIIGTEKRNIARLQSAGGTLVRDYPLGKGFNTFTLLGERNRVTLFINGVEVASTTEVRADLFREFLRFGSATGAGNISRYDVDYIRIYTGGAVRPVSPLGD